MPRLSPNSGPAALFSIWNTSLNCSSGALPCAAAVCCCCCCELPSPAAWAPPPPPLHVCCCGHDGCAPVYAACCVLDAAAAARPDVPAPSCVYDAASRQHDINVRHMTECVGLHENYPIPVEYIWCIKCLYYESCVIITWRCWWRTHLAVGCGGVRPGPAARRTFWILAVR